MYDIMLDHVPPDRLAYIAQWRNGGLLARMRSYIVRKFSFLVSVSLPRWWRQCSSGALQHLQGGKDRTIST